MLAKTETAREPFLEEDIGEDRVPIADLRLLGLEPLRKIWRSSISAFMSFMEDGHVDLHVILAGPIAIGIG